jgi:GT2 family glycosyltransferase
MEPTTLLISSFLGRLGRSFAARRAQQRRDAIYAGPVLHIVCATRLNEIAFWETSLLGISLRRADFVMPIRHSIAFENRLGLPAIYNRALERLDDAEAVVFVHDDVALYDFFLPHRIADGLAQFDVIGVAGSINPPADHAGFHMRLPAGESRPTDAQANGYVLEESGAVNHLFATHEYISRYGPAPQQVALLDGLFLAAKVSTLRRAKARFDERFLFHFYDLDFCRTCVARGLRIGTWPIALGHASAGSFGSSTWLSAIEQYQAKWGMTAPGL